MRERIAKSLVWMVWSRVTLQGVSFAATIMVARLLNPADYGLMTLAGIWTDIVVLLAELGLGAAIVQFQDLSDRELNTCFWLTMSMAVLGYGALYVAAPLIGGWFGSPGLSTVLRVLGLALPLVTLRIVPDALLRRRIELDRVSRAEVAAALVTIPLVLGMAWAGFGVWALVAGALATPLVQSAVTFALVRWRPGLQLGGRRVREILHYSLAMLGTRVGWAVYDQADAFILGKVSGDVALGFYSMAKQLALVPVEKVAGMVNQLATPVMAELQADREGLRAAFLKGFQLVAWATFPLCIGLILVARDLVEVVLTEKWISAVPVIQVLSMIALIRSVAILLPPVLMARYRARFLFGYTAVQLGIMPLAFYGGAVWWGAIGVALAWVAVYPIMLTRLAREAFRAIDVSLGMIWTQLWPPIAATVVMAASVLAVGGGISSWRHDLALARLTLMVSVGAATYAAMLLACGGSVRGEIQEAAGWLIRRRPKPEPVAAVNRSAEPARVATVPPGQPRHVLFVTYHFPPSMEMGAQTCAQIARYLPLYGWEPAVLTVNERFAEIVGDAREPEFSGRVVRAGLLPHPLTFYLGLKARLHLGRNGTAGMERRSEDMGRLRRWLLSLLLVGDRYTGWILPASLAGLKIARGARMQHLLTSGPPWTGHLVGLLLSRITRLPWTAHFRDPWGTQTKPASVASMRIDAALERMVIRRATFVVCVTDRHTETLRRSYPECPPGKFITIPNGFDGGEWDGVGTEGDAVDLGKEAKFTITYTGQLYQGRDPLPLFHALRVLIDAGDIDRECVQVELIGWCDPADAQRFAKVAGDCGIAECIHVRGPRARLETLKAQATSNLLLLLAEGLTVQIPGKTYEYLKSGRPILALTSEGAVADLLRRAGGAWVVDPRDITGIAAAVRETYRRWKEGRPLAGADQAVVSSFDRRMLAGRFAELFTKNVPR